MWFPKEPTTQVGNFFIIYTFFKYDTLEFEILPKRFFQEKKSKCSILAVLDYNYLLPWPIWVTLNDLQQVVDNFILMQIREFKKPRRRRRRQRRLKNDFISYLKSFNFFFTIKITSKLNMEHIVKFGI